MTPPFWDHSNIEGEAGKEGEVGQLPEEGGRGGKGGAGGKGGRGGASASKALRNAFLLSVLFCIVLQVGTIWRGEVNRSALATSQLYLVQQSEANSKQMRELAKLPEQVKSVLSEKLDMARNDQNNKLSDLSDQMNSVISAAKKSTRASEESTRASRSAHAKLNQKIITGPEAEQLKAQARRKSTILSLFPPQASTPAPTPRKRH